MKKEIEPEVFKHLHPLMQEWLNFKERVLDSSEEADKFKEK